MKRLLLILAITALPAAMMAQPGEPQDTTWKSIYRESVTKEHDLVHTKLEVRFDYDKAWMYGKEWVTLKPHFYTTDSVVLDAKGMEIKEVAMVNGTAKKSLKYKYDGWLLNLKLDKNNTRGEKSA